MANSQDLHDFESVKSRLAEIAEAVSDEGMPLDDALDLYEEAVSLGLRASDLLDEGIVIEDADVEELTAPESEESREAVAAD